MYSNQRVLIRYRVFNRKLCFQTPRNKRLRCKTPRSGEIEGKYKGQIPQMPLHQILILRMPSEMLLARNLSGCKSKLCLKVNSHSHLVDRMRGQSITMIYNDMNIEATCIGLLT